MKLEDVGFFDSAADYDIIDRLLPHWSQAGTLCFVTWRLGDSLPEEVLERLDAEIVELLNREKLNAKCDWKKELQQLDAKTRGRIQWELYATRDKFLDQGHGRCLLQKPCHATEIMNALKFFDEQRYFLTDAVVMPNHLHFIAAFQSQDAMLTQCEAWKRFTGRKINKAENQRGEFWQVDQFDHLIRSLEQFEHYRRYIANNPVVAKLQPGQFLHFQKNM